MSNPLLLAAHSSPLASSIHDLTSGFQ